jgi:hypothetical protein
LLTRALLRIKQAEHLKERDPAAFGRPLGLDQAPGVRAVRRRLYPYGGAPSRRAAGAELARLRVEQRGAELEARWVDYLLHDQP